MKQCGMTWLLTVHLDADILNSVGHGYMRKCHESSDTHLLEFGIPVGASWIHLIVSSVKQIRIICPEGKQVP